MNKRANHGDPIKFIRESIKDPGEACIEWPFSRDTNGYGRVYFDGRYSRAHRVAFILYTGETPPDGVEVAHAVECHNPSCINPLHLRFATRKQNNDDRVLNGTIPCGEGHISSKLTNAEVAAIRLDPRSLTIIAKDYAVNRASIGFIKQRKTWNHLPGKVIESAGHITGEAHTESKITEADVIAIRADTRMQKVIAATYGISQTQVSRIKRREKWAHVG